MDPSRHPLLYEVARGAQWPGTDEFPSCVEWADEHEAWLRFARDAGALDHYLPRLPLLAAVGLAPDLVVKVNMFKGWGLVKCTNRK